MEKQSMSKPTQERLLGFVNECQVLVGLLSPNAAPDRQRLKALVSSLTQAAADLARGVEPSERADDASQMGHISDHAGGPGRAGLAMRARRFIDDHYRERATDARLANALGVSRVAIARAFKRAHGQSIHEYLSGVRFAHAQHLLRSSDLKVAAIAIEVGYKSHKDLYRLIRTRTGMTPSRLRHGLRPRGAAPPGGG
jgi:AraC-like DNA-binding protein